MIVFREQYVLKAIYMEASKAPIMGKLLVNHLLRLLTEDDSSFQAFQQQDQQYLTQRRAVF